MAYDAVGQMESIENQIGRVTAYSFDDAGQTETREFPNGVFTIRTSTPPPEHTDRVGG